MENVIINKIDFPEFKGVKCNMMPFIQGNSNFIPEWAKSYSNIIDENYLEKGKIGFLTIDECDLSNYIDKYPKKLECY